MTKKVCLPLLLALGILLGSGCVPVSKKDDSTREPPWRLSAVLPHEDQAYWCNMAEGMQEEAALHNVDLKVRIPPMNYNVEQMTDLIRQEIASHTDALLVQGIDDPDYKAALLEAQEAGIQVALVDTNIQELPDHIYVGTDNYQAGRTMGDALLKQTQGTVNAVIISGDVGYPNLEERIRGIQDAVGESGRVRILGVEYDYFDSITVLERFRYILKHYPEVNTILAVEGTGCMSLGMSLDEMPDPLNCIIGFDSCPESLMGMEKGIVSGLMLQDSREMERKAVELLADGLETRNMAYGEYYTDSGYLSQAEYLSEKEGGAQ